MKIHDLNQQNRIMESQDLLRQVMSEAIGIYMAKEPKSKDSWRDITLWGLFEHLKHEIKEIDESGTRDRTYHNCLDAINLLAMLAVRIREHNYKPTCGYIGCKNKSKDVTMKQFGSYLSDVYICPIHWDHLQNYWVEDDKK